MTIFTKTKKTTKRFNDTVAEIISIDNQIKALKAQSDNLKANIKDSIEALEIPSSVITDSYSITYKGSTTAVKLDSKKFKSEQLATWKKYSKSSPVKSSITIKEK
jgi:predicted phage-related endonuclease